jgi:hypothetical protein
MNPDHLHRLVKLLADSGEAATLDDAHAAFARYGLIVDIGSTGQLNEAAQIQALTVINCAARSFMGNVALRGRIDVPLTVRGFANTTLADFVQRVAPDRPAIPGPWPVVALNGGDEPSAIRPWACGSTIGLGPAPAAEGATVAASVAAAGLAVSEAFSIMRGDNPYAGRRHVSLSLCHAVRPPHATDIPLSGDLQALWLVGLGHLGQAYAWVLGFLPPTGKEIVLQDSDIITASTLSTSLVSFPSDLGVAKTIVVANWLTARGWPVRVVARDFDAQQRCQQDDPRIALFGVDNAAARRAIEGAGFEHVVDAGLGAGYRDFRAVRIRSFPGSSLASEIWASEPAQPATQTPAYLNLARETGDLCGVTTLATRAVGAPFVGAVAAGLTLTAALTVSAGQPLASVIDLNLRDPRRVLTA